MDRYTASRRVLFIRTISSMLCTGRQTFFSLFLIYYCFYYCCCFIDRRIYFNLFKSTQTAAGLKAFWSLLSANGRYLMCKSLPDYFHLLGIEVHLSSCQLSACWVCSWFHNPPNSDMDYRIFNVCTWSFMLEDTHGVGHTDSESVQHFWLWKTQYCALGGIRTFVFWILSPMLYQLSHPVTQLFFNTQSTAEVISGRLKRYHNIQK